MMSPYGDWTGFNDSDPDETPNIEFELYQFIQDEFNCTRLTFDAKNVAEYKAIQDKLIMETYVNLNYHPLEIDSDPSSYKRPDNDNDDDDDVEIVNDDEDTDE